MAIKSNLEEEQTDEFKALKQAFDNLLFGELRLFIDYSVVDKFHSFLRKRIDRALDEGDFEEISINNARIRKEFDEKFFEAKKNCH